MIVLLTKQTKLMIAVPVLSVKHPQQLSILHIVLLLSQR